MIWPLKKKKNFSALSISETVSHDKNMGDVFSCMQTILMSIIDHDSFWIDKEDMNNDVKKAVSEIKEYTSFCEAKNENWTTF
ncbi:MAG: hypothetical protein A4E53_01523 [Pelotomaculum sp. PtaB.Bin104]|nr:MAG: hypothetical protein A4E53_01523 [Pelotomaculum sp. PtaB.Bin104]